jgi:ATP-dependent phosphofructokinase / diphosphate-dependent phosphofructokinase
VLRSGNVAIAQGGGPTAVINASLHGIVRECLRKLGASSKIRGARGGIEGVLQERWLDLREPSERFWKSIVSSPGAALGSSRKRLSAPEAMKAVRVLQKEDVRYFFYIGGNDSMDTALKMHQAASALHYEMTCCGIPKTIDNDLPGTDHCPGFGSAARFIAQSAIDLGTDVRTLPTPVSILEVMGRNTGWLTAATLLARKDPDDAPHLIYVPERPLSRGIFLRDVQEVYDRQGWVVVAVSEGVRDETGESWGVARTEKTVDGFGHQLPGDVATRLAGLVTSKLGLRARSEKPGLLGRSCALMASSVDRREAREVGSFGFSWAIQGNSGFMVSIIREDSTAYSVKYGAVPLSTVANLTRLFPAEYVAEGGNDIQAGYRAYVEPLIGHPLLRYARLDARAERPATA